MDLDATRRALERLPAGRRPRLTPGRLLYLAYHQPRAWLDRQRKIGWINSLRGWRGRRELQRHVSLLPPCRHQDRTLCDVHMLTGSQFLIESIAALHSLHKQSGGVFRPILHDDGTLNPAGRDLLMHQFPDAFVDGSQETEARLDAVLPVERFPVLRRLREGIPTMRKLIDVHAGRSGWHLVLDADILFFNRPLAIETFVQKAQWFYMTDAQSAYSAPREFLSFLAGSPAPERVNSGLTLMQSEKIDWGELELWARALLRQSGSSYYSEQTLVALLMAKHGGLPLPPEEYTVFPSIEKCLSGTGTALHYVDTSRWMFYALGWKPAVRGD